MSRHAAAALLLLLAACPSDRREAERAVRAYNEAAILAYRTRDFGPLKKVATEKEWGRVVVLVDLKSSNRLVLESELQALEVEGVQRPGPDAMTVTTRERWRYFDRPLDPGKPRGTVFVADMRLEYQFVRSAEGWRLDKARTLSADYLEPKGFRLEAPKGHTAGDPGDRRAAETSR